MRKFRFSCFAVVAALIIGFVLPSAAHASVGRSDHETVDYQGTANWPEAPEIHSDAAYLIEVNSGAVLYAKNGTEQNFPASTTKVLTAYLAIQNLELDQEITFSYNATHDMESGGSHPEFQEGEVLTVDECLQFLLVESVNECGTALAEAVSGDVDSFVELMNQTAQEFGATETHFANPHGLNDPEHYSTARDMALILWGCIQDEKFQQYAASPTVNLSGRAIMTGGFTSYTNHHLMLLSTSDYYNSDVVCGKTGYTSLAGSTLVTYASRGNMDLVCVIMKGAQSVYDTLRFEDTQALLDYGFDQFELISCDAANDDLVRSAGTILNLETEIDADQYILIPEGSKEYLTSVFASRSEEEEDKSVLGTRTWYYDEKEIAVSTVTLSPEAEANLAAQKEAREASKLAASQKKSEENGQLEFILFILLGVIVILLVLVLMSTIIRSMRRARERRAREERRRRRMERERRARKRERKDTD